MSFIIGEEGIDKISSLLTNNLVSIGIHQVMVIDTAGNIIVSLHEGSCISARDQDSLAALSAANFGAMSGIARLAGEEDFSLLFHKGQAENFCFTKITEDFLLIYMFSNDLSLGLIRMKVNGIIGQIKSILDS